MVLHALGYQALDISARVFRLRQIVVGFGPACRDAIGLFPPASITLQRKLSVAAPQLFWREERCCFVLRITTFFAVIDFNNIVCQMWEIWRICELFMRALIVLNITLRVSCAITFMYLLRNILMEGQNKCIPISIEIKGHVLTLRVLIWIFESNNDRSRMQYNNKLYYIRG